MNEKHVVSLELAKRMEELGFKQESDFYWVRGTDTKYGVWCIINSDHELFEEFKKGNPFCSAYHVGELGEMLPIDKEMGVTSLWKSGMGWGISYSREGINKHLVCEGNEADARAKMLIYLAEQGLITPSKG